MEEYSSVYTVETVIHFAKAFKDFFGEYGAGLTERDLEIIKLWETHGKNVKPEFYGECQVYHIYAEDQKLGYLFCKCCGPMMEATLHCNV